MENYNALTFKNQLRKWNAKEEDASRAEGAAERLMKEKREELGRTHEIGARVEMVKAIDDLEKNLEKLKIEREIVAENIKRARASWAMAELAKQLALYEGKRAGEKTVKAIHEAIYKVTGVGVSFARDMWGGKESTAVKTCDGLYISAKSADGKTLPIITGENIIKAIPAGVLYICGGAEITPDPRKQVERIINAREKAREAEKKAKALREDFRRMARTAGGRVRD